MVNIRPLTSELQKKATDELNEVESRIAEDIEHLKNWIQKQPHLKARTDDQWLVTFLRGCKYSLEKAKTKIDIFYSVRAAAPEYFKNRYPYTDIVNEILRTSTFALLPCSSARPTTILFRWDMCHLENCTVQDVFKCFLMFLEILLAEDDHTVISGVEILADYSNFPLSYVLQFTPTMLKKLLVCVEKAYPIRIKAAYVFNAPPVFETIFSMAKPFMTQKLTERVKVYSSDNIEELYKHVPKNIMPKEYGGDNPSVHKLAGECSKRLESYEQIFLDDEKYGSNEALRPASVKCPNDILGMEGSFRKLNVD